MNLFVQILEGLVKKLGLEGKAKVLPATTLSGYFSRYFFGLVLIRF